MKKSSYYFGPDEDKKKMRNIQMDNGSLYTMLLNNCIYNHSSQHIMNAFHQMDIQTQFKTELFYFCITGLPKTLYSTFLHIDSEQYFCVYSQIHDTLQEIISAAHYVADIFMLINDSKEIAILFSPNDSTFLSNTSPLQLTTQIHDAVEKVYQRAFHLDKTPYFNVTAFCGPFSGVSNIHSGYHVLKHLKSLAFFKTKGCVITEDFVSHTKKNVDYRTIQDQCKKIEYALDYSHYEDTKKEINTLFSILSSSYCFSLYQDAISFLKNMLLIRSTVYGVPLHINFDTLLDRSYCFLLKECHVQIAAAIQNISNIPPAKRYSTNILTAIYYIKNHFADDISVTDIANYISLQYGYFCQLFKEETGISPRNYITHYRIETAKRLLSQGQKISHVATQVGFCDSKYFSRTFREIVGITPSAFRSIATTTPRTL